MTVVRLPPQRDMYRCRMFSATLHAMGIGLGFGIGPLRFYIPLVRFGRRRKAKYWTHNGCTIHHRTQDTANSCKNGR